MTARVRHVRYLAEGWGIGGLWLEDRRLVLHELPRPGAGGGDDDPLAWRFAAWFRGEEDRFEDLPLDLDGASIFTLALTRALRAVGRGETVTYGELAARAGSPRAARAAGSFCAQNRFPLVVPCHRVVASGGLGGYGSLGAGYKRRLLEVEGATPRRPGSTAAGRVHGC